MPVFEYIARDRAGQQSDGSVEAADKAAAVSQIQAQGLTPISVIGEGGETASVATSYSKEEVGGGIDRAMSGPLSAIGELVVWAALFVWKFVMWEFGVVLLLVGVVLLIIAAKARPAKPQLQHLATFSRQLANLLKAGMPLNAALNSMRSLENDGIPANVVDQLHNDVREGRNLSASMAGYPEVFPDMYINMMKAGESSGSMVGVLERLADHYKKFAEVKQAVTSALVYPCFVIGLGMMLIYVFLSYILPKFMTIFEGMDVVLPATTRILQGLSGFFEVYGLIVLLVVRLIYMLIKRIFSSEEGRERLDNWLLTAPLIKTVVRPNLFGQLSRTLGALLQNGVPVLTALRITENVIQNKAIQKAIEMTREGVTDGKTIAQPMARSGQFDKLMVDLVHIGEQTGDVPAALNNLAETYDDTLMVNLQRVTAMIGPALIVWIAGLVGFMLMGVLQAMFKITGTIGQ